MATQSETIALRDGAILALFDEDDLGEQQIAAMHPSDLDLESGELTFWYRQNVNPMRKTMTLSSGALQAVRDWSAARDEWGAKAPTRREFMFIQVGGRHDGHGMGVQAVFDVHRRDKHDLP